MMELAWSWQSFWGAAFFVVWAGGTMLFLATPVAIGLWAMYGIYCDQEKQLKYLVDYSKRREGAK